MSECNRNVGPYPSHGLAGGRLGNDIHNCGWRRTQYDGIVALAAARWMSAARG
jgi:hypothetical protein